MIGRAIAMGMLVVPIASADEATRLSVGFSIYPQLEQYVGDVALFAETLDAQLLVPAGRRGWAGVSIAGRRDFLLMGARYERPIGETRVGEWWLSVGAGTVVPLGDSNLVFERLTGESASNWDRLYGAIGIGQTFARRERSAVRVAVQARLVPRGGMLSVLESLDDGVDQGESIAVYAFEVGYETRWGSR